MADWSVIYNDGNNDTRNIRKSVILSASGKDAIVCDNLVTQLSSDFTSVREGEKYLVVFIHLTPVQTITDGIKGILGGASGFLNRLFLVLVSGEGVRSTTPGVQEAIDLARTKQFGGFTYWPWDIETATAELNTAFARLASEFNSGPPDFDEFHRIFNSEVSALPIYKELVDVVGERVAQRDPLVHRFLAHLEAPVSLPKKELRPLKQLIISRSKYEEARSKIRHHDLSNCLLPAIIKAFRAVRKEIDAPDWVGDLSSSLVAQKEIKEKISEILKLRNECNMAATSKAIQHLLGPGEQGNDIKYSDDPVLIEKAAESLDRALTDMKKVLEQSKNPSEDELRTLSEACRQLIDVLKRSS